jgi:hypothetical protein
MVGADNYYYAKTADNNNSSYMLTDCRCAADGKSLEVYGAGGGQYVKFVDCPTQCVVSIVSFAFSPGSAHVLCR